MYEAKRGVTLGRQGRADSALGSNLDRQSLTGIVSWRLVSSRAQEAPGLIGLLPRREPLRPVDARELAGLRIPGDEARDEEAGAEVEVRSAPEVARP